MTDDKLIQRMKADRGWLAHLMEKVPGFRGYLENTTIWEADHMVRSEIARRLNEAKPPLNRAIEAAGEDVRAGGAISALESLLNLVQRVANKVRFADYGHSALTAKIDVRAEDLARLLEHDRSLFELLQAALAAAAAVSEGGPEELELALRAFEGQFDRRKDCLVVLAGTVETGGKEG